MIADGVKQLNAHVDAILKTSSSLTAEEKNLVDAMIFNSGLASMLGIELSLSGDLGRKDFGLGSGLPDCSAFPTHCLLFTADSLSFMIGNVNALVKTLAVVTAVASLITSGLSLGITVPLIKIKEVLEWLKTALDGFVPSDLATITVSVAPLAGTKCNVGEECGVEVQGDFRAQTKVATAVAGLALDAFIDAKWGFKHQGVKGGPVIITKGQAAAASALKEQVRKFVTSAGLQLADKIFAWLGGLEAKALGVKIEPRMYGDPPGVLALLLKATSLNVSKILAKLPIKLAGSSALAVASPAIASYDDSTRRITCSSNGTTSLKLDAFRFDDDEVPWWLRPLGLEWKTKVAGQAAVACTTAADCQVSDLAITSPKDGYSQPSRIFAIKGQMKDPKNEVKTIALEIVSLATGASLVQKLPASAGTFSMSNLVLSAGRNRLTARIDDPSCAVKSPPVEVVANVAPATILLTLTWDQDSTDADLYVYEPQGLGGTCYYKATKTSLGGSLDTDDTDGYGPENYSLSDKEGDKVAAGLYTARIHYFDGSGPLAWKLRAIINENQPTETTKHLSGTLATSNSKNDDPAGSGPDWTSQVVTVECAKSAAGTSCSFK